MKLSSWIARSQQPTHNKTQAPKSAHDKVAAEQNTSLTTMDAPLGALGLSSLPLALPSVSTEHGTRGPSSMVALRVHEGAGAGDDKNKAVAYLLEHQALVAGAALLLHAPSSSSSSSGPLPSHQATAGLCTGAAHRDIQELRLALRAVPSG